MLMRRASLPLLFLLADAGENQGAAAVAEQWRTGNNAPAIDPEAAFPTAQLAAELRAEDTRSAAPLIGSNVDAGADLAAELFAGELGPAFLRELSEATTGLPPSDPVHRKSLIARTLFIDRVVANATERGCRQIVLLAAGLDARAWRLPQLRDDSSMTVFELDVPAAVAYKKKHVHYLEGRTYPPPSGRRVVGT